MWKCNVFRILSFDFWLLNFEFYILNFELWVLSFEFWIWFWVKFEFVLFRLKSIYSFDLENINLFSCLDPNLAFFRLVKRTHRYPSQTQNILKSKINMACKLNFWFIWNLKRRLRCAGQTDCFGQTAGLMVLVRIGHLSLIEVIQSVE